MDEPHELLFSQSELPELDGVNNFFDAQLSKARLFYLNF
jgi:hypothetical protein